jgi:FkbM family methyltransferase
MLLSVALIPPTIKILGVDPNRRAVDLLRRSITANDLSTRVAVVEAAVADGDRNLGFDETGSVEGHISAAGRQVAGIDFARLVNEHSRNQKCLVKIDVEGFETVLLAQLSRLEFRENLHFVVELHIRGFNGVGDPRRCFSVLRQSGAKVADLRGRPIEQVADDRVTQVQAVWGEAPFGP